MKKKKKNYRKLLKILLLLLNVSVGVPFLFAFFAQAVSPSAIGIFAFCGLAFPYLLYANIALMILWFFVDYRYSLISILLILVNLNNIDRHFQFKGTEVPEPCVNCVKVMSYNARLFNVYNESDEELGKGKQKIFDFLAEEKPDIVCFQEYFYENSDKIDFPTTDTILSILGLEHSEKYFYQYFPQNLRQEYFFGLAIFSRYRIVNAGYVQMPDSSANSVIFADIRFKGDTIRIYDVHLASLHLDNADYEAGKKMVQGLDDPDREQNVRQIYKKVKTGFEVRTMQVKALRAHRDTCPYPIVLCGDFNDSPASYSYNKLATGLNDSFRKSGQKMGTTYNGDVFPAYRIDYILYDPQYRAYQHTIATQLGVSDHFPIYTYISLQKNKY